MRPNIIWNPSPNYRTGRQGSIIGICNHQTAGVFPGCLNWMRNPISQASAHYLVTRDGQIFQIVKDEDTAWHAGIVNNPTWSLYDGTNPNRYLIGIEHECYPEVGGDGNLTDAQYQASLWLHQYLINKWNIATDNNHIIGHFQLDSINRSNCPGSAFPWIKLMNDLKGSEQEVEPWKSNIIAKAKEYGLITQDKNPDDGVTVWFTLAVVINVLEKYIFKIQG